MQEVEHSVPSSISVSEMPYLVSKPACPIEVGSQQQIPFPLHVRGDGRRTQRARPRPLERQRTGMPARRESIWPLCTVHHAPAQGHQPSKSIATSCWKGFVHRQCVTPHGIVHWPADAGTSDECSRSCTSKLSSSGRGRGEADRHQRNGHGNMLGRSPRRQVLLASAMRNQARTFPCPIRSRP